MDRNDMIRAKKARFEYTTKPRNLKERRQFPFNIDPDYVKRITELMKTDERSFSYHVREAVKQYLDRVAPIQS